MVHLALLVIHIATGTVGLLLGPVAMRQDVRRFVSAERSTGVISAWYRAMVLLICLSATGLVIERRTDLWWLVPVSVLTYGLAVLAKVSARRRHRAWIHGYVHGQGGSYIALVTALIVVALVVDGPVSGPAELIPWLAPTVIGTVLIEVWRRRLSAALVVSGTCRY
ncbi:hypothetical protein SD37_33400 [Amycolatopsis orientalis]|uniref:DUF2306 domain-containing protein n=1 Tax=Amycolatopsis orientalis TaxID=31958 RepID=A0A193C6B9_AMYOR|nr:hypothetical protein [Amycolatopsis orientalis]ANN20022.1 hypothetical protein SD37_33400 [Amycolatopsis orientalis]